MEVLAGHARSVSAVGVGFADIGPRAMTIASARPAALDTIPRVQAPIIGGGGCRPSGCQVEWTMQSGIVLAGARLVGARGDRGRHRSRAGTAQ